MTDYNFRAIQKEIARSADLPIDVLGEAPNAELLKTALTTIGHEAASQCDWPAFHFYYRVNQRVCAAQGKTNDVEGIESYISAFPAPAHTISDDTRKALWENIADAYREACAKVGYTD